MRFILIIIVMFSFYGCMDSNKKPEPKKEEDNIDLDDLDLTDLDIES